MFRRHKKIFTVLISVLAMSVPLAARASWWQDAFTWVIHAITAVIVWIIGIFVTLGASLTDLMLQINIEHLNGDSNKLIETGWQITRDLANLGFVLAIIIIAFATIIQYKQYGAKKLLPKLIAAAIIVNFSMAIATPVIGFSNTITGFFLGSAAPATGGPGKVASVIAGAFNPQKLLMDPTDVDPTIPPGLEEGKTGGFGTVFLVSVASGLFAIMFTTIAAITFFAFAFMLMIRYVILTLLLVLAPIAWLAWVIPGLENLFGKWWSHFFKWSFFAPAMSFFIYLALISAEQMKSENMTAVTGENFTAGAMGNLMVHGSQMIILAGLMLGGLIASEKMGVYGSKGAMGVAIKAGNWAKKGAARTARRGALRAGSFAFRAKKGAEGKSLAERSRTYAQTRKTGLGRWATGLAARGLTRAELLGTETLAKEHDKVVSGWPDNRLLAELPSAMGPRKIAIMKELAKRKKLHKAKNVRNLVTQSSKDLFARFGQGEKWGDVEKAVNINVDMNKALDSGNIDKFKEETKKFVGERTKNDIANMPWGEIFKNIGDDDKGAMGYDLSATRNWAEGLVKGVAEENYALLSSILQKVPSKARDAFVERYNKAIEEIADGNQRKKVRTAFNNTLANYASTPGVAEPTAGGAAGGEGRTPAGGGGG